MKLSTEKLSYFLQLRLTLLTPSGESAKLALMSSFAFLKSRTSPSVLIRDCPALPFNRERSVGPCDLKFSDFDNKPHEHKERINKIKLNNRNFLKNIQSKKPPNKIILQKLIVNYVIFKNVTILFKALLIVFKIYYFVMF